MITRRRFLSLSMGSALGAALATPLLTACGGNGKQPHIGSKVISGGGPVPAPPAARTPARAVILLYMTGGASQLDTFDPKPGIEGAGGLGAIETAVPGLQLSALLPGLAQRADRLAVIRSLVSKEGNHNRARHLMHTGYVPAGGVEHPAFGSILALERSKGALPGYVSIGGPGASAGFLGAGYSPFVVGSPSQKVRNLERPDFVDQATFDRRIELWRALEDGFAATHQGELVGNNRAVAERALTMMRAAESVAFDLDAEPPSSRAPYGDSRFGLGCLMARRLVEVGVPFVEVGLGNWDTHTDNMARVKPLCADLDQGMAALLDDLRQRGMLDTTLVVWAGDFGRTPWLNPNGGRDHYPQVSPLVLAGGGVRGGQVIGATDPLGKEVVDRPLAVPDLYASVAHALALDPDQVRYSRAGRPLATVDGGTVIDGLF
jgi:uncharacterized protein (DUF1501 family)